ncbi:lipoprotein-releasing system transmembrane subunit LolC [Ahniella affigens]|uniref:Lipoprotein-releasing system transmembrane subunit LolC n=1 Tax=Ahniella affigens TaxID=2021234 RepID=A0A2P1PMS6_9GAMM|nr:lipoprotein-releasing ABC transporter permease subunit [Ahniella affigens]AVP96127.1 lipoprotein-releasing system transmembrane subunit LolC [Ahniella affigens]
MIRALELMIGLRYTRAKRRNHFISFISLASMLGIALGVCAQITIVSVINGFGTELRARTLSMVAHATVSGFGGEPLQQWPEAVAVAQKLPHVVGAAPYVEREVMLQGGRVSGAIVRGIDPTLEPTVSAIREEIKEGDFAALQPGEFNIVLGKELALWAGASLGDSVLVYAPQVRATPAGLLPQMRRFRVVGLFEAGVSEFDRGMAFIHIQDAQKLFRQGDGVTGVRLKLDDLFQSRAVAESLGAQLQGDFRVRDWTQDNRNLYQALNTEKITMFVIMSLVVAVAAFNLVSSLVMLVIDKQADIAILRTLGLSPGSVMQIFVIQGVVIACVGIAIGTVGGILLAENADRLMNFLEAIFGFDFMPADVYYISALPSDLRMDDVLSIVGLSFVLSTLATLYPAWKAARTKPAEALRYE